MSEPTLLDRIREIERRLALLETGAGTGLSGTDQTIKGSHDRLDSLLGAGKSTPDGTLVTNLNADTVDGYHAAPSGATAHVLATGAAGQAQIDGALTLLAQQIFGQAANSCQIVYIPRKITTANTATGVFRITTTNEAGDADAGAWGCWVFALAARGYSSIANATAGMTHLCTFARAIRETGVTGNNSAVLEVAQSAVAATDAAVRTITDVTVTLNEVDEYNVDVEYKVDIAGNNPQAPTVSCWVLLQYGTFTTPPMITAL